MIQCEVPANLDSVFRDSVRRWFIQFRFLREGVRVVSFWRIAIDPIRNQLELDWGESLIISKLPETLDCTPRRHVA